jgi:hypothetical protein
VPGCDGELRVGFVVGTDYDEFGRTPLSVAKSQFDPSKSKV